MDETTQVTSAPAATETSTSADHSGVSTGTEVQSSTGSDDFSIDDNVLNSLSPESRTVVEPMLRIAKERFDKVRESNKGLTEKATAWDKLVTDNDFRQWYTNKLNPPPPPATRELEVHAPADRGITDEMLQEVSNDPIKYAQLLEKRVEQKYNTKLGQLEAGQRQLKMSAELDSLSRNHPDMWDLDKAGLLEPFLYYYTDLNKRPMAEAYQAAKKVSNFFLSKANEKAVGIVNNAKASVTETPSTSKTESTGVIYAKNSDEAMRMQISEFLPGGLKRQVLVKK
jgi:hypothetical protein